VSSFAWAQEHAANHLAVAAKVLATSLSSPSPLKPVAAAISSFLLPFATANEL
jgi:hypothetical protein